jgi:myo-inositol-1(or 4)-monophosphatase
VSQPVVMVAGTWKRQLDVARRAAREAGRTIRDQFGHRAVSQYKGQFDVQLNADIQAQRVIHDHLRASYPGYGFVAEEAPDLHWTDEELLWAVDPLDGTNNFGYGIAHCCISIGLFRGDSIVLALVVDPLLDREFSAVGGMGIASTPGVGIVRGSPDLLARATVSLVTDYSQRGRLWGNRITAGIGARCKRITSMWAPALDLALISTGALDAMVCHEGGLLDVCTGIFLVQAAGGCVLDLDGRPLEVSRASHGKPISFVAARSPILAKELCEAVRWLGTP